MKTRIKKLIVLLLVFVTGSSIAQRPVKIKLSPEKAKEKIIKGDFDALSADTLVIEGDLRISNVELKHGLALRNVIIKGGLYLDNVQIEGDVVLDKVQFTDDFDMNNVNIKGDFNCRSGKMRGVSLKNIHVTGDYFTDLDNEAEFFIKGIQIDGVFHIDD